MAPLRPGDMLRVTKREYLWRYLGSYDASGNATIRLLQPGEVLTLIARNPNEKTWWAKCVDARQRNWRDEFLFCLTSSGKYGYVIRECVVTVKP
jgi:hypothetical protein